MKQGKKQPKAPKRSFPWRKVGVIAICVIVAILMVVSTLGFGWLTSMKETVPGDTVLLEYTIRDSSGRPLLTTSQSLFNTTMKKQGIVMLAAPLRIVVGTNYTRYIIPVEAYIPSYEGYQVAPYGIFGDEMTLISQGLIGIRQGETGQLSITNGSLMESIYLMTEEQFKAIGGNISEVNVGDQLLMRMPTDRNVSAATANQSQL